MMIIIKSNGHMVEMKLDDAVTRVTGANRGLGPALAQPALVR
jgi:hypothetical protein